MKGFLVTLVLGAPIVAALLFSRSRAKKRSSKSKR